MEEETSGDVITPEKPKRKMGKLLIYAGLIVLVVIGLAITYSPKKVNSDDLLSLEEVMANQSAIAKLKVMYQPNRDAYGYGKIAVADDQGNRVIKLFEIKEAFKILEKEFPVPDDFWRYKYSVMRGQYFGDIDMKYYVQPEFLGNDFKNIAIPLYYSEPDLTRWTPVGYGGYPKEIQRLAKPGDEFTINTFFYASFGVETYQGIMLKVVYPHAVTNLTGAEVDTSQDSAKYITTEIEVVYPDDYFKTHPTLEGLPKNIAVVDRTYPIFQSGWIRKIRIHVKVSPDAPPGNYGVGFDAVNIPPFWDAKLVDLYMENKIPFAPVSIDKIPFTLGIFVTEQE